MPDPQITYAEVYEEVSPTLMKVVVNADRTIPQASSVITATGSAGTGFDLYVYDLNSQTPTTAIYSALGQSVGTGSSGPMFNSFTLSGHWVEDTIGYTWLHTLDMSLAGLTIQGGRSYRVCYLINRTYANGGVIPLVFVLKARSLLSR